MSMSTYHHGHPTTLAITLIVAQLPIDILHRLEVQKGHVAFRITCGAEAACRRSSI